MNVTALPAYADTVVIGGGSAGAVVAARLAQHTSQTVVLLEAGPDYGALAEGRWPADLLDARALALSHDWGYTSAALNGQPGHPLERARVIGGCSAHNGCIAMWGHRADYDAWAAAGNPGWATDDLLPLFHNANQTLQVRRYAPAEISPFHAACLTAMERAGIPLVEDLNNLDENEGASTAAVNVRQGLRWNTALAYLDPVRTNPRLTVVGNALVDRVRVEGGRAASVVCLIAGQPASIEAERVVVCAGAYGSPAVLLRSGIGPVDELRALGVETVLNLPGVGRNLHDHPSLYLTYAGTPALIRALEEFERSGQTLVAEQSLAKARSPHCATAFDLHLFPVGGRAPAGRGVWDFTLPVGNMAPVSRGQVTLTDANPASAPVIDTGYLTDPDDADLRVLMSGLELARDMANQSPLREWLGEELPVTAQIKDAESVRRGCLHYFHPVGTCKLGPASDPAAVVDADGRLHGMDNLYVADASVMPVIPRANTYVPVLVAAEHITAGLIAAG
jgi:choline dehydrogenase